MNKPKFTLKPWCVHRREIHYKGIDLISSSIFSDNSPIGIIASMPHRNKFLLEEYRDRFDQDEVDANAALIVAAPDMYEMLTIIQDALRHGLYKNSFGVITEQGIDALLANARGEGEAK